MILGSVVVSGLGLGAYWINGLMMAQFGLEGNEHYEFMIGNLIIGLVSIIDVWILWSVLKCSINDFSTITEANRLENRRIIEQARSREVEDAE